jgi:surface antigen
VPLVLLAVAVLLLGLAPVLATKAFATEAASQPDKSSGKKPKRDKDKDPVWQGSPGTNLAHDTYGYAWPAAPDCNEGNVADGSCVNDGLGFFQGQCTSWVAHRVSQRNGISFSNWFDGVRWGNAVDWAKVAKGLGYARNKVPAAGAIGWYRRGHVSYVEDVNSDGSVVISEMNTDGHNGFHVVTVYPGSTSYPDRFIHVADVVPVDYTAPDRPSPVSARRVDRGATLTWQRPADDTGVTGYRVLRDGVPLAETTTTTYTDRLASPGQTYTYTVTARDAAGNVSESARAPLAQTAPAPPRLRGRLREATEVSTPFGSAVCGLTGKERSQHLACRIRTLDGWRTVRTGRQVPWGTAETRAFVASPRDNRVWFCRELPRGRTGCVPLDLTTLSWGFDRQDKSRAVADNAVWKASRTGPTRCGLVAGRPSCSVLADTGWKAPRRADNAQVGDPLTRAFVAVGRGVAFCRVVDERAVCSTLDTRRLKWERAARTTRAVSPGRWTSRRSGPTLCSGDRGCRVVAAR